MSDEWMDYIPWIYISIQGTIALTVSMIGAKYVRNEFVKQKKKVKTDKGLQINIQIKTQQKQDNDNEENATNDDKNEHVNEKGEVEEENSEQAQATPLETEEYKVIFLLLIDIHLIT